MAHGNDRPGNSNLIPNSERTPEELREMGRKGGIASGKARRRNKKLLQKMKIVQQVLDDLEKREPEKAKKVTENLIKHFYIK